MDTAPPLRVAYVASYLPRECGIATFTHSVLRSVERAEPHWSSAVVAVNQPGERLDYPALVAAQFERDDPQSYDAAAGRLNAAGFDVLNIQHEYGLFGGTWGSHLLRLLEASRLPSALTLHTVLPSPDPDLRRVTRALIDRAETTVVLARGAIDILARDYGVSPGKLRFIPHGVPNVLPDQHDEAKRRLGFAGRQVLATCGLINSGKGIEYALEAVARLVDRFPQLLYVVAGETHPGVRAREGEAYRQRLEQQARELGVQDHVLFVNRYLSYPELIDYLLACDLYVVPYLNLNQIVSGTLAYAMGCGCAIVSTPSLYAREVLDGGRGMVVPACDPPALAGAAAQVLGDDEVQRQLRQAAYAYARYMIWPEVGRAYVALFRELARPAVPLSKAG